MKTAKKSWITYLETMDTSAADTVRCSRYFGLWRAKLQTVKQIEERVSTSVAPSVAIHFKTGTSRASRSKSYWKVPCSLKK